MTQKVIQKRKKSQEVTIEDIYHNKNFIKPKEKPLETIFEEPKVARDGTEHYTSVKRYKRYLLFEDYPNSDKLRKRKMRVKKLMKSSIPEGRLTRSRNKRPRLLSDFSDQEYGGGDGVMICLPDGKNSNIFDNIIHQNRVLQHDGYALRATSSTNYKEVSSEESESDDELYRVPVKVIVAEDTTRSCSVRPQTQTEKEMDLVMEDEEMVVQIDSDSDENANTKVGTPLVMAQCSSDTASEFDDSGPPSPTRSALNLNSKPSQVVTAHASPKKTSGIAAFCAESISDIPDLMKQSSPKESEDCGEQHGTPAKTNMCEVT